MKDYIRKYLPDVTDEQMRQWEASNALEYMMLDGEKRYFRNAGPNLFRVDSACYDVKIAKEGTALSGSEKVNKENLPEIITAVQKDGKAIAVPKRMRVTYTLTVDTNAVPAGKLIAAGCPIPQRSGTPAGCKFVSASEPEYVFSPQDCRHSTLYMEKRAVKGEPTVFSETFEYTSCESGTICGPKMSVLMTRLLPFIKNIPPNGRSISFSRRVCVSWLPD